MFICIFIMFYYRLKDKLQNIAAVRNGDTIANNLLQYIELIFPASTSGNSIDCDVVDSSNSVSVEIHIELIDHYHIIVLQ